MSEHHLLDVSLPQNVCTGIFSKKAEGKREAKQKKMMQTKDPLKRTNPFLEKLPSLN
jgi:hypothetical protein